MCGITGIMAFNLVGKFNKIHITTATQSLRHRGPDFEDIYLDEWVGLGHRRLSIIDTSEKGHQPMWDRSRRYCIIYNGEIFNFLELKKTLVDKGVELISHSDTEVLLNLFILEKENCLRRLNGFFAFCIYDRQEQTLFLARDRFGVKPLLYLFDEDKFIFASEMKTILHYGIDRTIDFTSLNLYLQLNYIPAPDTIFKSVKKLLPGHYLIARSRQVEIQRWYKIPYDPYTTSGTITYDAAKKQFADLLEDAVKSRLVADVPLGTFLSGGIDSSIVTALASRHKPDIRSFSIGFRDDKYFDETQFARLVAQKLKIEHTVFTLSDQEVHQHLYSILDHIDEPFADSSAINVYMLSRETRKHATVALSGDGADELLGGYNKHRALFLMKNSGLLEAGVVALQPLWERLPRSRHSRFTNLFRQAHRFAQAAKLDSAARYWRLASFADTNDATALIDHRNFTADGQLEQRILNVLSPIRNDASLNDMLLVDMQLVLQNDMLTKVDLMSMANGLEIRSPFLDFRLVEFAFSLPEEFKITRKQRKKILVDSFRQILPEKIFTRPKKGFEVPLAKWLRRELREYSVELLSRDAITSQGIFNYEAVDQLLRQLNSSNPGDSHARIWALLVFQHWFKRYCS